MLREKYPQIENERVFYLENFRKKPPHFETEGFYPLAKKIIWTAAAGLNIIQF